MKDRVIALIERYVGRVTKFTGESNVTMRCPFHKGGQEGSPSFSINVDTGLFLCFTCKASGAIPKLLTMLGLPKEEVDLETLGIRDELEQNRLRKFWKNRSRLRLQDPMKANPILPEKVLKPYEWCPTSLVDYGFSAELLRYMDIGFDTSNNRITYPIRDMYGNLAGVAGGAVIPGTHPKYKVYKGKWVNPVNKQVVASDYGPSFDEMFPEYSDFHNHDYLWNFDLVYPRLFFGDKNQTIVVTEGYKACLWLLQNNFLNTVALMGSAMSTRQLELLRRLDVDVVLFLDNDEAGKLGTHKIGKSLYSINPRVRVAQYPHNAEGSQPDNLSLTELTDAIQGAMTFSQHMQETRHERHNGRATTWG